jgi:hypothetical protein
MYCTIIDSKKSEIYNGTFELIDKSTPKINFFGIKFKFSTLITRENEYFILKIKKQIDPINVSLIRIFKKEKFVRYIYPESFIYTGERILSSVENIFAYAFTIKFDDTITF